VRKSKIKTECRMRRMKFFASFAVGVVICFFSVALVLLKENPPPVLIEIEV